MKQGSNFVEMIFLHYLRTSHQREEKNVRIWKTWNCGNDFPALKTQLGYGKSVTLGDVGVEFALFLSYY